MLEQSSALGLPQCRVLVVDDDLPCLAEYVELVEGLGYPCDQAADASTALRAIAEDSRIGIVVTDLQMPGMDGITMLEELSARFMQVRPLVALVVTGHASMDTAVQAMRSSAMDFLAKPVSRENLSAALRRASSRWNQLVGQFQLLAIKRLGGELEGELRERGVGAAAPASATPTDLTTYVERVIKTRQNRSKYFDPELFAGPSWDILLELAAAGLKGQSLPTSSACATSNAPLSTALRYVNQLVEAGLVRRQIDPADKRRSLLDLEPQAMESMRRYLIASWNLQRAGKT